MKSTASMSWPWKCKRLFECWRQFETHSPYSLGSCACWISPSLGRVLARTTRCRTAHTAPPQTTHLQPYGRNFWLLHPNCAPVGIFTVGHSTQAQPQISCLVAAIPDLKQTRYQGIQKATVGARKGGARHGKAVHHAGTARSDQADLLELSKISQRSVKTCLD